MQYQKARMMDTDIHAITFDPKINRSQVTVGTSGKKEPLSKIRHAWFDANGFKTVGKINFGFFDMATDLNEHVGILLHDQGFAEITDADKGMECYLLPDGHFVVTELDWDQAQAIKDSVLWGGSLSYALVINGQKDLRKVENFDHAAYKYSRTMIGQRADGTMIIVVADKGPGSAGLTADQEAALMLYMGAVNAINADGGGSSEMIVNDQIVNQPDDGNERRIGSALLVFEKEGETSNMEKLDLIIDPGHGGKDPGGGSNKVFLEKDKVLQISLYQKQRLEAHGVRVKLTRETDVTLEPADRTAIVKGSGAPICLSNHCNSIDGDPDSGPDASGCETIHSIYSDGFLAKKLAAGIVATGLQTLRRVFTRKGDNGKDYYFMHRDTGAVETVIIEYGFADNRKDADLLANRWQDLAESVVKTIVQYLGKTYDGGPKKLAPAPSPAPAPTPSQDPAAAAWEAERKEAREFCMARGLTDGENPAGAVTREQLWVILYRLLNK